MAKVLSTTEIARMLGVPAWRVARLYELGLVPERARVAGRRIVPTEDLPLIVDALRLKEWLPASDPASFIGGGFPLV